MNAQSRIYGASVILRWPVGDHSVRGDDSHGIRKTDAAVADVFQNVANTVL